MSAIDNLRAELTRERAAHAATRQVLEDAARDRGGVVVLSAEQRRDVLVSLRAASCCYGGGSTVNRWHRADCLTARALRIIGGPEETQRQVDAAHAEALAVFEDDTLERDLREIYDSPRAAALVATLMPNFDEWLQRQARLSPGDLPDDARPNADDSLDRAAPAPARLPEPE